MVLICLLLIITDRPSCLKGNFYLYFGLNLRQKWMPDIHCGKQTKLSKTMGSPLDTMGEIISSQCPRAIANGEVLTEGANATVNCSAILYVSCMFSPNSFQKPETILSKHRKDYIGIYLYSTCEI